MNKPYKAVGAFLIALVGGIAIGYVDDALTKGEIWAALSAAFVNGGAVYGIDNKPRDERGALSAGDCLVVALVAFAVVVIVAWMR